jgi:protein-arginine kinase activator protein McsA
VNHEVGFPVCKKCRQPYEDDEDADEYGTGLCYHCFEESLEELEERRRERIARANEY